MSRKFAVLGSPIGHSLSPIMHRAAFEALNLDYDYEAFEVAQIQPWLAEHGSAFSGLSITMPLKQGALRAASWSHELAVAAQGANTLIPSDDGWSAFNTDIPGLMRALRGITGSTLIIGTGATARSAALAVISLGMRPHIWGRNLDGLTLLAQDLDLEVEPNLESISDFDLVISTLPHGRLAELIPANSKPHGLLFDLAYGNKPAEHEIAWLRTGKVLSGRELLLWQGVFQQRLFHGLELQQEHPAEAEIINAMRGALNMAE